MAFRPPEYAELINPMINAFTVTPGQVKAARELLAEIGKKAKAAGAELVKAGGYPLPEDWSPRGVLPCHGQAFLDRMSADVTLMYYP